MFFSNFFEMLVGCCLRSYNDFFYSKILCQTPFKMSGLCVRSLMCRIPLRYLKVVGNEKIGGSGKCQMLGYDSGLWRSRFIFCLNMQFLS
jgi:hypothetical protein